MKKRIVCLLLAFSMMLALAVGAYAASSEPQLSNVTDAAGLLNETQVQRLEQMAQSVAQQFGVGVYIVTVEDYGELDPSGVYEATYGIYHDYTMGVGAERNGIMLLLSMAERDFALFCYGDKAEYAFNEYGLAQLENEFLDAFAENNWYTGFEGYIRACADYLEKAENGNPVSKNPFSSFILVVVVSLAIAGVVCAVLVGQMKSVHKNTTAGVYAVDGLTLTEQYDQFTHRTESRRKIERDSSSSGSSRSASGGGGSGRTGKF